MHRPHAAVALAILCVLLTVSHAIGQIETAAPLLEFPLSARVRAMGDNGVADNSDPGNIHFNPANVVGSDRIYARGTWWDVHGLPEGATVLGVTAGFAHRMDNGFLYGVDLTYGRLGFGESEFTPTYTTPIGPSPLLFEPTNETFTVAFGIGHVFGDGHEWRVGFAEKRFWAAYPVSVDTNSITIDRPQTYAFDIGATVAFRIPVKDWNVIPSLALAWVNQGADISSDFTDRSEPLPTRLHYGGAVQIDSKTISLRGADVPLVSIVANVDAADHMHNNGLFTWGLGAEIGLADALFVRSGFTSDPGEDDDRSSNAWGIGVGLPGTALVRFDYAHTSNAFEPDIYGVIFAWGL
jgi:hypothetical protein